MQEKTKIADKEKEIRLQESKEESLHKHQELINKKLEKLKKYDEFLKKVQSKH